MIILILNIFKYKKVKVFRLGVCCFVKEFCSECGLCDIYYIYYVKEVCVFFN